MKPGTDERSVRDDVLSNECDLWASMFLGLLPTQDSGQLVRQRCSRGSLTECAETRPVTQKEIEKETKRCLTHYMLGCEDVCLEGRIDGCIEESVVGRVDG